MTHLVTLTAILILHITAQQLHRMSASCVVTRRPAPATLNTRSCGVQTWRPKLHSAFVRANYEPSTQKYSRSIVQYQQQHEYSKIWLKALKRLFTNKRFVVKNIIKRWNMSICQSSPVLLLIQKENYCMQGKTTVCFRPTSVLQNVNVPNFFLPLKHSPMPTLQNSAGGSSQSLMATLWLGTTLGGGFCCFSLYCSTSGLLIKWWQELWLLKSLPQELAEVTEREMRNKMTTLWTFS